MKFPSVFQILKWAICIFDLNGQIILIQIDIGGEPLFEHLKADNQISNQLFI